MILVDAITIKEFRGIRDLTLNFKGKNFAVCGPNGTGKSGVVDALEFALTGNVSRLSGEGKGEVSLKQHGPHVDFRDNPDKARVTVTLTIPSLGKTVTVERSAKTPSHAQVTPAAPDVLALLAKVAAHPEIVLSRRELIRYVLATPGDRAREVQALLHLDRVEDVRVGLQKIANGAERQLPSLLAAVKLASDNLLRALAITELTSEKLLAATNAQRAILGLPALPELTATTSLRDGLGAPSTAKPQPILKAQAVADLKAAREALDELATAAFTTRVTELMIDINNLAANAVGATGMAVENFYTTGLSLIEAETCPLCDTTWDVAELRAKLHAKLDSLKEFSRQRKVIERKIGPLTATLARVHAALETLARHAALATPPLSVTAATDFAASCQASSTQLNALLPLPDTLAVLGRVAAEPSDVRPALAALEPVVAALPEPGKQESARDYLTVAQERLETWREARRKHKTASEQAVRARKISDTYVATSDALLIGLYAEVQKDFAALYRFINQNDENAFTAKLVPSIGKLGFDVDFYGRGFFPPGAYHSEGHQDGMGLCLYLALMRHLQGPSFTFAVLDDVLMSVDTGHRREVCALLKQEFPHTQFIITTHDPVWLRHMKTVGVIGGKNGVQFRKWSVEHGPTEWHDRDVWTEINDYLQQNDVRSAAALLRHFLEYTGGELCHRLRVPVEYRYDGQYQLGELLPPAIIHFRKLFKNAKEIANGWNQKETVAALSEREATFGQAAQTSRAEEWQVNVAVHFNSWENLKKEDFIPVAKAYRDLLAAFTCPKCSEYLHILPDRETAESLRCDCGQTTINLKKKTGSGLVLRTT